MTEEIIALPKRLKYDLTGKRFGRWSVLGYVGAIHKDAGWLCRCTCGNQRVVDGTRLRSGESLSCGCYRRDMTPPSKRHGMSHSTEYAIWKSMNQRCYNSNRKDYPRYGGGGIQVCQRWRESFEAFYTDMGPRPSSKHSLDRINNDGSYKPDNCRWLTQAEQSNNTVTNHHLTFRGRTLTIAQWSRETGIAHNTLSYRLAAGWTIERALTEPIKKT